MGSTSVLEEPPSYATLKRLVKDYIDGRLDCVGYFGVADADREQVWGVDYERVIVSRADLVLWARASCGSPKFLAPDLTAGKDPVPEPAISPSRDLTGEAKRRKSGGRPADGWLSTAEAEDYLGFARGTFGKWRSAKRYGFQDVGHAAGKRAVRYRREDLDDFMTRLKAQGIEPIGG